MSESSLQTTVRWPQYLAGLAAAGGALAIGTALGWSSPATPRLVDEGQYFPITSSEMSWVSSIVNIGCAVSCLPIGYLLKKFGKKWTMLSLVVPFMIGWGLVIWAQNFMMLLIGRFMLGLAGGAFCISAPQYSAEIAEKEIRGTIGSFFQLLIISGILFVYLIGPFMTVFWTNIVCACIPLVFGAVFIFMPESPVFLVINNREAEAAESYKWLRGKSYDPQTEVDELKKSLMIEDDKHESVGRAFTKRSSIFAMVVAVGLAFFQQMCGVNVVIFYSTVVFGAAKTGISADTSTIIVGAANLAATFASSLLVDRLGRKMLLMISNISMICALTALGVFFFIQDSDPESAKTLGWLPITSLVIYIIGFALGFGPMPWLMMSEVYSKEIAAVASPLTGAFNWLLAFLITATFGGISDGIGIGPTFWIFAGLSLIGTLFILFAVPETKGKSMAEIQRMLAGEKEIK